MLTSRSRVLQTQRCPRSRYWLHEAKGTGYELVKAAIPLVTGVMVHQSMAELLLGADLNPTISATHSKYDEICTIRGLKTEELENESFVYNEQKALIEGLTRLLALRVIPRLLQIYDVLEVETMDSAQLAEDITFRSIPDALLRRKDDGDLYLLSLKTTSEYGKNQVDDARTDMQGLSEAWAYEQRKRPEGKIRGIQMLYLVKGTRRAMGKDDALKLGLTLDQYKQGWRLKKTDSPLLYGYADNGSFPIQYATSSEWHCSQPHPMRKSQWYPTGECPGDGRTHKRGDNFKSFPVWDTLTTGQWLDLLLQGDVDCGSQTGEELLNSLWVLPVPNYRTPWDTENWYQQTRAQEERVQRGLLMLEASRDEESFQKFLNLYFPQYTHSCRMWGSRCPAWDLCWGSPHIQSDPLGSGLYQIKTQYEPKSAGEVEGA